VMDRSFVGKLRSLIISSGLLVLLSLYMIFTVVPNERFMGPVQRILYFHVGSAVTCYLLMAMVLVGSIGYLTNRKRIFDNYAAAGAEVGFIFCTITLITGMIWGHTAWNTVFRWEPRLVSFLCLWFIFLALFAVRIYGDKSKIAGQSAVLGVVGAITVPLVVYSINLLPHIAQLHPQVIATGGLKDPSYRYTLRVSMLALALFGVTLAYVRAKISELENRIENI
jgi:heme exporter protein C